MGKFKDLTGQKYERLTVLHRTPKPEHLKQNCTYWLCKCDCGKEIITTTSCLNSGNTKSCGCYQRDIVIGKNKIDKKKYNTYDLNGEYGIGYTTKAEEFYFDLEDYDKIKDCSWHITTDGYVVWSKSAKEKIMMHRLIMNPHNDLVVDHKNGLKSRNDNRKYNLRICTQQENRWNSDVASNNTSGITGIRFDTNLNKWSASIQVNKQKIYLGLFDFKEDAYVARESAELKYFGKFKFNK